MEKQIEVIRLGNKNYFAVPSRKDLSITYLTTWLSAGYCVDQKIDDNVNQLEIQRNGSILISGHAYVNCYDIPCFVFEYSEIQRLETWDFQQSLDADCFQHGDCFFSLVAIAHRLSNFIDTILWLNKTVNDFTARIKKHPQIEINSAMLSRSGMPIGFKKIEHNYILVEGYL